MTGKTKNDIDHIYRLSFRLTERDRTLCRLLHDHKVLTTSQVVDVGFTGRRRAEERLTALHGLAVMDRFRPRGDKHAPFHYTLGPAGAFVVAAERGVDVSDIGWRRDRLSAWAYSPRLSHLVGANGVFTALIRHSRSHPSTELAQWWSEEHCVAKVGAAVRPDGYGEWREAGGSLPFFLEYDTGTERLGRLASKLEGYSKLAGSIGHRTWVLFVFPSPRREAEARRALVRTDVAVATCAHEGHRSPDEAIWLAVGPNGGRVRLAHLGDPDQLSTDGGI